MTAEQLLDRSVDAWLSCADQEEETFAVAFLQSLSGDELWQTVTANTAELLRGQVAESLN
ncbi:MAG: hypothetical protein QOJ70_1130 [Acidobacteriota bacterium]|jgi:hypothetical protein|nr:hypothetical protein [Acidobacteriota bacterium]